MPRSEPEDEQHQAEKKRQHRFDRSVRVDPLDHGIAEEQAEATRDARTEDKPAQERDAVRATALAPQNLERRDQQQSAGLLPFVTWSQTLRELSVQPNL